MTTSRTSYVRDIRDVRTVTDRSRGRTTTHRALDDLRRTSAVHIWSWHTGDAPAPADLLLLDEPELRRARGLRDPWDAAAFVRTRAGAGRALAGLLDVPPQDITLGNRACPTCGCREHGPPALLNPAPLSSLAVSLARTDGYGMFAVCADTSVGVDVEAIRPVAVDRIADLCLTAHEHEHVLAVPDGPVRALRHLRC
nr:hypothetical protein OG781_31395 [Streptomyces sp. NBC_00830]